MAKKGHSAQYYVDIERKKAQKELKQLVKELEEIQTLQKIFNDKLEKFSKKAMNALINQIED